VIKQRLGEFFEIALVFGIFVVLALAVRVAPPSEPEFSGEKTIQFSFTAKNDTDQLQQGSLRVYSPLEITSHQKLLDIESNVDFERIRDESGNQILHFPDIQLAPFERQIIRVRARLAVTDQSQLSGDTALEDFLKPEPYVETGHPELIAASGLISGGSKLEMLEDIYRWVTVRLEQGSYMADDRGALWAYRNRAGDCTQHMYLFLTMARIKGIPARGMGGYRVKDGSRTVIPTDYHNWAEVYLDGAWHVVDTEQQVFMSNQSEYIATRIIRPASESLLGSTHRFSYQGDGIRIVMN